MDLISQVQSFVRTLSSSLAHTVEYLMQSPSIPVNYQQFNEAPLRDRVTNLFKLFAQTDALMASLPATFSTEGEQLRLIAELTRQNQECGSELDQAKVDSEQWRQRLMDALESVANHQFNTYHIE